VKPSAPRARPPKAVIEGAGLDFGEAQREIARYRHVVVQRLHRAQRLSEEFLGSLLGWVHSGFSVHGEQTVEFWYITPISKGITWNS